MFYNCLGRLAGGALMVLIASAQPVLAHAILVDSQPPSAAAVAEGAVTFRLRYNSRIDPARSRFTLVRPDRTQTILDLAPEGSGDVLTTHAELPAGAYVLRWQVLAIDGHITRGELPFRVAK